MQEELKSLKNPTRILTIIMFAAVFVTSIGAEGLSQLIPGISPVVAAGIVAIAGYAVTQYGTEKRIVRAEELKDLEYTEEESDDLADSSDEFDEDELMDDGC